MSFLEKLLGNALLLRVFYNQAFKISFTLSKIYKSRSYLDHLCIISTWHYITHVVLQIQCHICGFPFASSFESIFWNLTEFWLRICMPLIEEGLQFRPATLSKKRLWHRCFPVNFAKFLRTSFSQNISGWLLLLWHTSKFLMMMNCFCSMVDGRMAFSLISIGTIVRDPHHRKSPTRRKQDLSLRRTWVQV